MAGNKNSGRKPTPKAKLKLYGSPHAKTKGDAIEAKLAGSPEMPGGLDENARWLWDFLVPQFEAMGITKRLDTVQLWTLCEIWGLYRAAIEAAKKYPIDKDLRIAVTAYRSAFDSLSIRFGMTPADRQKLELSPGEKADEFEEFLKQEA